MKNNSMVNLILHGLQLLMQILTLCSISNVMIHGAVKATVFRSDILLLIALCVFLFYLEKCFIKTGKFAFLAHLVTLVLVVNFMNAPVEVIFLSVIPLMVMMVFSLARKNEKPIIAVELGAIFVSFILGSSLETANGVSFPYYAAILYVLLYCIWVNLSNMNHLLMENAEIKSFRPEQAMNVNSVLLAIFVLLALLVMLLLPALGVQNALSFVLKGFWSLIVAFLHLFHFDESESVHQVIEQVSERTENIDDVMVPPFDMGEGNPIMDAIVFIIGGIGLVFVIIFIVQSIRSMKYERSEGMDVKEFVRPVREKKTAVKGTGILDVFQGLSTEEKIRRIYKRKIEKGALKKKDGLMKVQVPKNRVPEELTKAYIGDALEYKQATEIYEEARYSNHSMTPEQVEQMKLKFDEVKEENHG